MDNFRWNATCASRLAYICVANREEFLGRDKPHTRGEKDSKSVKTASSFYRGAADWWNDDDTYFPIDVHLNDEGVGPHLEQLRALDPNCEVRKISPEKVEQKVNETRSLLDAALANYGQSGQGDERGEFATGVDEEAAGDDTGTAMEHGEHVEQVGTKIMSNNFYDFCNGNMPLLLWYVLFLKYGMLASLQSEISDVSATGDGATPSHTVRGRPRKRSHNGRREFARPSSSEIPASRCPTAGDASFAKKVCLFIYTFSNI